MKRILFFLKKMLRIIKITIYSLKVIQIPKKTIMSNFSKKMMELWRLIGISELNLVWKKKKFKWVNKMKTQKNKKNLLFK